MSCPPSLKHTLCHSCYSNKLECWHFQRCFFYIKRVSLVQIKLLSSDIFEMPLRMKELLTLCYDLSNNIFFSDTKNVIVYFQVVKKCVNWIIFSPKLLFSFSLLSVAFLRQSFFPRFSLSLQKRHFSRRKVNQDEIFFRNFFSHMFVHFFQRLNCSSQVSSMQGCHLAFFKMFARNEMIWPFMDVV